MTKRVKELIEQATTKISFRLDPNTYKHIDDPDGDLERFEFDKEKFAELIVRECVKVCSGVEEDGELSPELGTFADGALLCREEIKAHFGVEE